jgi:single-strand DNA-binding protein
MATANLNRWVGTANLTRDPEMKETQSGTKIANLRVAVNARVKRGEEWVDKANYFDVVVFGAKAETMQRFLTKGSSVAIDGRLDYQEWEAQDGGKRNRVVIIADSVQFTDGKPRDGAGHEQEPETGAPPASSAVQSDDDIPF